MSASDLQRIRAIQDQALAFIAELMVHRKPAYYVAGQNVSWDVLLAKLRATLEWCDHKLESADASIDRI